MNDDTSDLFDIIRVSGMTTGEKIGLANAGQYLDILRNDQSMSVRIRARFKQSDKEVEADKERRALEKTAKGLAILTEESYSSDFSVRVKAKAKLRKIREHEGR